MSMFSSFEANKNCMSRKHACAFRLKTSARCTYDIGREQSASRPPPPPAPHHELICRPAGGALEMALEMALEIAPPPGALGVVDR